MNKNLIKGEAILFITAILWGSCFVFMKTGMEFIGPFTLGAFRFLIGAVVLLPFLLFSNSLKSKNQKNEAEDKKNLAQGGIICGVVLFFGASFQQIGLVYTTSGKAAFITELEIVVVALLCAFIAKKVHKSTVAGILIAVVGMYLLCINEASALNIGDFFEFFGAIFWGIQVLLIDKYSKLCNVFKLALIQFVIAGSLSAVLMIFEHPNLQAIQNCAVPILYTAIIEVALCYTLQLVGQRYVPPVVSSMTMALQAVFAALFGFLILNEVLTVKEIIGCVFMLLAIIMVQLPLIVKRKNLEC